MYFYSRCKILNFNVFWSLTHHKFLLNCVKQLIVCFCCKSMFMCTISFIPHPENNEFFILTDNRDEAVNRPAVFPRIYSELDTQLFYPKDKRAGGTWFGISRHKRAMALMNGAFTRHKRKETYRKSRGIVVKELLAAPDLKQAIKDYDFDDIEPFFGLIFSWAGQREIFELIWDGEQAYLHAKDPNEAHIWSSAMTYSEEQHQKRVVMFEEFLKENGQSPALPDLIWEFHHIRGTEEDEGIIIERGFLQTTSISQFQYFGEEEMSFRHENLITEEEQENMIFWNYRD